MRDRLRRLLPIVLVSLALGGLLVFLGARQWRWLERLRLYEHARLQRVVGYSAWLLKEVFDHELTLLARSFESPAGAPAPDGAELAERWRRWRTRTRWPAQLAEVYVVTGLDGNAAAARLQRLDPTSGALTAMAWSAELAPLRDGGARRELARAPPMRPAVYAPLPALLVPTPVAPHPGRAAAAAVPAVLLLRLDRGYLVDRLFPELVAMFFPPPTFSAVDLAVVEVEGGEVLYSTSPLASGAAFGPADAVYGLLDANVDPDVVDSGGLLLRGNEVMPSSVRVPSEAERRWWREMWTRMFYSGHWQLRVRHGGAPIPARVEAGQRRELVIGFGLLALLTAGLASFATETYRARRLARQQAELVARVSHELRTPLAVLAAAGDNLADAIVHDRAQIERYGKLIQQASRRLREVAENVLHLARRQGAAPPSPLRPLDVGVLVEESLRLSRPQLEQAGFAVEKRLPEVPLAVLGEPRALRSALLNLISNALKYGRAERWLRLTVAPVRARGGEEVEIAIEDHGPGIPADEIPRLFEPYYRGERARAEHIEGTGLGLSVVRDVAAAHRGRVSVESAPGRGSVFRLHLPRFEER